MRKSRLLNSVICVGLLGAVHRVSALDPSRPPGANFDLRHWKCTLPDATASEISPSFLTGGYTSAYFYTAADGGMAFWCPVTGGTTVNSTYPRSELRELIDPRDSSENWTGYGSHTLRARCKVLQQPSTGKVIIGQVHGYETDPLVKVQWNDGALYVYFKSSPGGPDMKYGLGTAEFGDIIDYEIHVEDGVATVTLNGVTADFDFFASSPAWETNTFYFKAGAYVQDNLGAIDEGGLVVFYELVANHPTIAPSPIPPEITLQPISQTVSMGGTAILSVAATSMAPMTFQWRKNGTPIAGATGTSLTVANFRSSVPIDYDVLVSNAAGSITSVPARLYLNSPVRFVGQKQGNGGIVYTFAGIANALYQIEMSTNLSKWTPVATNRSVTGILTYTNRPDLVRRFFRARQG